MPGGQGPKTVKGAQSDPNYLSRLLLYCVPVFHKVITPAYIYFTVPDRSLFIPKFIPYSMVPVIQWRHHWWTRARSECLLWGGKNYGYATGVELRRLPRDRKIAGLYRRRCTANARRRLVGASFCASLPCRDLRWQLWCVRLYTYRVTVA